MSDECVRMRTLSLKNFEFYQEGFEAFLHKISAKTKSQMATAFLVSFSSKSPPISLNLESRGPQLTDERDA